MIKSLKLDQFGILPNETFEFSRGLNVFVGSNGTGKSQILKLGYTVARWSYETYLKAVDLRPDKATQQKDLASKLVRVFRPDALGRLAKRGVGRRRCTVRARFFANGLPRHERRSEDFDFSFSTQSSTEVVLDKTPDAYSQEEAVFFPTKEVLSMFPGFAGAYRSRELAFDETYYDLCLALDKSLSRGPRQEAVKPYLEKVESILGGRIYLENGRFELRQPERGRFEIPLVAEGLRKMGTIAYLLANGTLERQSVLFWDEPETNLNPQYMRQLAEVLVELAAHDTQIFVATHSLFMLRELSMLAERSGMDARFFALTSGPDMAVSVSSGRRAEDVSPIVALDEEIAQSERYLDLGEEA